jgi:AraC family transcriptional regulator
VQYGCIALAMDKRHRPIEITAFRWSSAEAAQPVTWSDTREVLFVAIGAGQLERFMSHAPDLAALNINLRSAVFDPHVVSLAVNMRDELQAGCPTGKPYSEALSLALTSYLFKRYGVESGSLRRDGLALSPKQVSRIREYIQRNLARDIGLAELAGQLDLSPHYFSMRFKHALGVSPHHYVLRERIHEAQRLLAAGRTRISEVALGLGFSDQSHFSQAFRKITGTTPKRYQSTC